MQRKTRLALLAGGTLAVLAVAVLGLAVATSVGAPLWGKAHGGRGGWSGFTEANGTVTGRFVTFHADPAAGTITALSANASHPLVATIQLGNGSATGSEALRRGAYLLDDGAGDRLVVEDAPLAGFQATSRDGATLTITFPEGANITTHDAVPDWSPAGATIAYADGEKANLVLGRGSSLNLSGQTLTVTLGPGSHAGFSLVPEDGGFGHHGLWHGGGGFPRWHR